MVLICNLFVNFSVIDYVIVMRQKGKKDFFEILIEFFTHFDQFDQD